MGTYPHNLVMDTMKIHMKTLLITLINVISKVLISIVGAMAVPRMALSPNGLFPEPPLVWAFTECPYMGPFIEQFILETHCLR